MIIKKNNENVNNDFCSYLIDYIIFFNWIFPGIPSILTILLILFAKNQTLHNDHWSKLQNFLF